MAPHNRFRLTVQSEDNRAAGSSAIESQLTIVGRPLEVINQRAIEVSNLDLPGAIGVCKPDLSITGPLTEVRDAPVVRVSGCLIAEIGSDEFLRGPPPEIGTR